MLYCTQVGVLYCMPCCAIHSQVFSTVYSSVPGLAELRMRMHEQIRTNPGKSTSPRTNPNSGEFGRNRAKNGRIWANLGKKWAKTGRKRANETESWQNRAKPKVSPKLYSVSVIPDLYDTVSAQVVSTWRKDWCPCRSLSGSCSSCCTRGRGSWGSRVGYNYLAIVF